MEKQTILVVDDGLDNHLIMKTILEDDYHLLYAERGKQALSIARFEKPDLILLDVMMPDMDGFETCRHLKENLLTRSIPVLFITALGEVRDEAHGFEVGGVDYITKPVNPSLVRARVKTHLALYDQKRELQRMVADATKEIRETQLVVIERLGRAAEFNDNETGKHVIRMSHYSRILAVALGMSEKDADTLKLAAPMHDVGKIRIPDNILKRKGSLDHDEMEMMREHTRFGAELIGNHHSELLQVARTVALSHHEKWDGTGYPDGLSGEEIPLVSRIVAIADVFDVLTSKRPYKEAWPIERAIEYIESRAGAHFDPNITPLLRSELDKIMAVYECYAEDIIGRPPTPDEIDDISIQIRR